MAEFSSKIAEAQSIIKFIDFKNDELLQSKQDVENATSNEQQNEISNKINIVQEFDNQVTLEKDVVDMDKLTEQQSNAINNVLKNNVQKQISNILSVASVNDYVKILQKLLQ